MRYYITFLLLFTTILWTKESFSVDELTYLSAKKEIKVCVTSNFMPFEDMDEKGKHIGFSSSYFEIFQQRMPIPFKVVATENSEQSLRFLNSKKCDVISTVIASKNRELLGLTKPYITSPLVIVIQSHVSYITDFKNLKDKELGITHTCAYTKNIKRFFPTLNRTIEVESVEEGLNRVAKGKIFGQVGTLAEIGYLFNKNFRGELKIAGKTDEVDLELSMAVGEDEPILFEIMQRFINELDSSVHYDIVSQWTSIKYEQGVNYALGLKVVSFFLLLLLGGAVFLLILKNKNRKLNIAKEEIEYLNLHLEDKIKDEVAKNREKDIYLFQQSRLAQMGGLLSMIAHQWRQPLGSINNVVTLTQLNLMAKKDNLAKKEDRERFFKYLNENFSEINGYVKFLSNTMNDFQSFYKPNKAKEMVSVAQPVNDAVKMMHKIFKEKGIVVITKLQSHKSLLLHKNEITQVLLNILRNSEDAFDEEKVVHPKIKITTKEENGKTIIAISDNAGGISKESLNQIFDPYFSTKDEKVGTGIGLYMSKIIIEEHNDGTLSVQSIDNEACFSVIF